MDSDFFTDGYADKKALEEISKHIEELEDELHHGYDHTTGRSDQEIKDEIAALMKQKEDLLVKLEHEEDSGK